MTHEEIRRRVETFKPNGMQINEIAFEKMLYITDKLNQLINDTPNDTGRLFVVADPICNTKFWMRFEIESLLSDSEKTNDAFIDALKAAVVFELYPSPEEDVIRCDIDISDIYTETTT